MIHSLARTSLGHNSYSWKFYHILDQEQLALQWSPAIVLVSQALVLGGQWTPKIV